MFLELITAMGNDVLIPIKRIKYIILRYANAYIIKISTDDGDWEEYFNEDAVAAKIRYEMIKKIVKCK